MSESKPVPHKWANEIKAWADGAEIETKMSNGCWTLCETPYWNEGSQYRVKPERTKDRELFGQAVAFTHILDGEVRNFGWLQRPEDNIKCTFDGETLELKSVELVDKSTRQGETCTG